MLAASVLGGFSLWLFIGMIAVNGININGDHKSRDADHKTQYADHKQVFADHKSHFADHKIFIP